MYYRLRFAEITFMSSFIFVSISFVCTRCCASIVLHVWYQYIASFPSVLIGIFETLDLVGRCMGVHWFLAMNARCMISLFASLKFNSISFLIEVNLDTVSLRFLCSASIMASRSVRMEFSCDRVLVDSLQYAVLFVCLFVGVCRGEVQVFVSSSALDFLK